MEKSNYTVMKSLKVQKPKHPKVQKFKRQNNPKVQWHNLSLPHARVTSVKLANASNFCVQAFLGYFTKKNSGCERSDLNQNIQEVNSNMCSPHLSAPDARVALNKLATTSNFFVQAFLGKKKTNFGM